jgi:hypothetical protein
MHGIFLAICSQSLNQITANPQLFASLIMPVNMAATRLREVTARFATTEGFVPARTGLRRGIRADRPVTKRVRPDVCRLRVDLAESRNEAMGRLIAEASPRGGNAIVAMRFDTTELDDVWTEICAYGIHRAGRPSHRRCVRTPPSNWVTTPEARPGG